MSKRPLVPRQRSDPKKLAEDKNAIMRDLEARTETDTYAPVSPPARPAARKRTRPTRRIISQGIAGFRRPPTDA